FTFDYVFGTESAQSDVFDQVGDPLIRKFLTGRNTTFLTYGQTSSGKTYTMGTSSINQNGIVPSAMTLLFSLLPKEANLTVAFIEIYNEEVYDLLNQNSTITIREDGKGHTHWTGVQRLPVHDLHHVLHYLDQGLNNRATNATDMNEVSSRSHAIFSVILNHQDKQTKLHFVDLAGSERMKRTTAEVDRRKEGIYINGGLLALGNVISSLASDKLHIPYRDSKLTRLLQDSLGGSALTLMIACVSPVGQHLQETVNTLQYASRARSIK
ncbi:P-loop containing nucleoside triphosphate hydrolase protein, partial [Sporodiniella umbellata]